MKNFRSDNLAKAQLKQQMLKEQGTTTERLDHAEKARRKPNSMRLAINAKCWDCCCEDRDNIRYCASEDCSLFRFRPYKAQS